MTDKPINNYGPRIRYLRKRAGLSQEEAAKLLGISRSTLIRYEKESPRLPVSIFIQMTEIYDCDVFDILHVHEPMDLEKDISPYYLMKAQARRNVKKEIEADRRFGTTGVKKEYYNQRYRMHTFEIVKMFVRYPQFIEEAEEILAEFEKDEDFDYFK
ncbi:MAG: helix-turn-helix domain-containing protein, partial [Candidatus Ornithomonoglobus sp.]